MNRGSGWRLLPVLLLLWAVVGLSLTPEDAWARRHGRRARAARRAPRPQPQPPVTRSDASLGQPTVVVLYRRYVAAFAQTAEALRRISRFAVVIHPLDPGQSRAEQREEVGDRRARLVIALGPLAAQVVAPGVGDAAVVFAYGSRAPATAVRRGAWIAHRARPRDVLRWLRTLVPGLSTLGVVVRDAQDPLAEATRLAARRAGIKPVFAQVQRAGDPLRALVALIQERPQAVWLGSAYEGWDAARLRAAIHLQSLFRIPIVGVTREHVRAGLLLAIDSSPDVVATAAERLVRTYGRALIGREAATQGRGRRRPLGEAVEARQLIWEPLYGSRVSLNERTARALGLDPRPAVTAGAVAVQP